MAQLTYTDLAQLKAGDKLPEHIQGPITRGTLALFAGASNDHMLLHIDSDYAKAAGMPDVFAHGMLSMAYLAQLVTHWTPAENVREWGVRFSAITPLNAVVHCNGEATEIYEADGKKLAKVRIGAKTAEGLVTLDGDAVIALN
jgi:acyl dehydratase